MTDQLTPPDARAPRVLSRRGVLALFGAAGLTRLLGCASPSNAADAGADAEAGADALTGADAALEASADAAAEAAQADVAADAAATAWATGGTRVIAASYPDPFASPGTACSLTCQATIGPCHTTSIERVDVSDGVDGLPVRLSLRLLDESCNPVTNAIVEIWHTNNGGIYSGAINNNMCNRDAADRAAMYFRGYQRTDANGRVDFNTCFPGWYSSRAVHIHVRVLTGDYAASDTATATVISQLFFTDELIRQIFSGEPLYSTHGQPDTLLGTDNVIGGTADKTPYICDVARMSDGVMLASKTFIVRTSGTGTLCTLQGSGMTMPGH